MKARVGLFHVAHHCNLWRVYQYTTVDESGSTANHIEDHFSFENAIKASYKLNGWGEPRTITKRF